MTPRSAGVLSVYNCLQRIVERDPEVRAWAEIAPQPALAEGPLSGVPFGVKDIFDTAALPTAYGSPLFAGRRPAKDAALVERLRRLGAVMLGKTHTTAFAYFDAAPTRNPRDLEHTPGGSSSGSAAAVACGMAAFALGTQTQGSVIRPASFCGVVGFKPTFGKLPLEGVLPFAPSLDTAGLFAPSAQDLFVLWRAIAGEKGGEEATGRIAVPETMEGPEARMEWAFGDAIELLRFRGLRVQRVPMPPSFRGLAETAKRITAYEGARTHEATWRQHGPAIGAKLAQLVEDGLAMPESQYQEALEAVRVAKQEMGELFRSYDAVATPAAPGAAPKGLESTGDPRMNSPWTALGTPAISVPMRVTGLPLGLQLAGAPDRDMALIALAMAVEDILGGAGR